MATWIWEMFGLKQLNRLKKIKYRAYLSFKYDNVLFEFIRRVCGTLCFLLYSKPRSTGHNMQSIALDLNLHVFLEKLTDC